MGRPELLNCSVSVASRKGNNIVNVTRPEPEYVLGVSTTFQLVLIAMNLGNYFTYYRAQKKSNVKLIFDLDFFFFSSLAIGKFSGFAFLQLLSRYPSMPCLCMFLLQCPAGDKGMCHHHHLTSSHVLA